MANTKELSKKLIKVLSKFSTPDVCFAMGNTGALDHHIRPLFRGAKLCGPALTVRTAPGDNLFCHKVIEYIQKGEVVIVSTLGEDATFREGYGEINIRVVCGGVSIDPGDLILGDENGVVVVPRSDLKSVIEKAIEKIALEDKARKEILKGKILPELSRVNEILEQKRLMKEKHTPLKK